MKYQVMNHMITLTALQMSLYNLLRFLKAIPEIILSFSDISQDLLFKEIHIYKICN